jgi:septal ring factor EnvC (AmiA/AmiB activator)
MKFFGILILLICFDSQASLESHYLLKKKKFLNKEMENRNILSDLYQAQLNIRKLHGDKTKLKQRADDIQRSIDKISPLVNRAEEALMRQKIQIQKRLAYILKFQDMSFLKIVFSSQTPSQMDRNLRILKGLTEMDYMNLRSYFQNVKALRHKRKELVVKKEELQTLLGQLDKKEHELVQKTQEKNEMLAKLNRQQKNLLEDLKKLRAENKNLTSERQEFLTTILEPLFFERKGSLKKPIDGRVLQSFGILEHPTYKTQFRHKGIFFASDSGTQIRSVSRGKVSYIGEVLGFGQILIIDHGDHYFSVYSHLKNIEPKLGHTVEENQVIAQVGPPHPLFGEGLYFELRHFSEPIDPMEWFDKKIARR